MFVLCTDEVQDPAHGAVPSAGQHPEVRNISEEVEPGTDKAPSPRHCYTEHTVWKLSHTPVALINIKTSCQIVPSLYINSFSPFKTTVSS